MRLNFYTIIIAIILGFMAGVAWSVRADRAILTEDDHSFIQSHIDSERGSGNVKTQ